MPITIVHAKASVSGFRQMVTRFMLRLRAEHTHDRRTSSISVAVCRPFGRPCQRAVTVKCPVTGLDQVW